MGNVKFTDFGLSVKKKLLDLGMTQRELEGLIRGKTELFVDASYMYKIMTGQREAPKIVSAICEILGLEVNEQNGIGKEG